MTSGAPKQLDAIADELYAMRPDGFAAARDEAIRRARAENRKDLAGELGKLRRPAQSAWLVNLISRNQREELEELFGLADDLGRARSASEMQRVTARRREIEERLIRHARELAEESGVSVSASVERELRETLGAALAQPEVANEVRRGRLLKPASYAGFGTVAAAPSASPRKSKEPGPKTERPSHAREEVRRRRVEEAQAVVEAAASVLAEQQRLAGKARERQQELRKQVDELDERVRQLRTELTAAGREAVAADRRREQAEKDHKAAAQALERASR